ncbi:MAG: hypothetical protein TU35_007850 [Thermoproteus sp. AZ2]|jgi:chromosome segregation ATPase|uniref:Uncharacterized protein n=1 Tax=Thermoproteus sp. AZ2 TaxID=1609232 RepID=A0ACC6V324_9CREN|nr:MAG: hypothetical protein TU35_05710 [Thermoproteus sp. AZ2]
MSVDVAYLAIGELEKALSQYEDKLKGIEDTWRAFVEASQALKGAWDGDSARVRIRLDQIQGVVDELNRELEVLAAKRELGLISEEDYQRLSEDAKKKIAELEEKAKALRDKAMQIEARVKYVWARSLTKERLSKIDLVALEKRVEDMYSSGKIDQATYAKMKTEVAIMKAVWDMLNVVEPSV